MPANTRTLFSVFCLSDEIVTGGGYQVGGGQISNVEILLNGPVGETAWNIAADNNNAFNVQVDGYARCAKLVMWDCSVLQI